MLFVSVQTGLVRRLVFKKKVFLQVSVLQPKVRRLVVDMKVAYSVMYTKNGTQFTSMLYKITY